MFDLSKDPAGFQRLTIAGKVSEAEMKDGLEAFLRALDDSAKTDFLYTIQDIEIPSLQALAVELGYVPQLIASLSRMGRIAVVADQSWIRTAADVKAMLIPGLRMETFSPEQEQDAINWLTSDAS